MSSILHICLKLWNKQNNLQNFHEPHQIYSRPIKVITVNVAYHPFGEDFGINTLTSTDILRNVFGERWELNLLIQVSFFWWIQAGRQGLVQAAVYCSHQENLRSFFQQAMSTCNVQSKLYVDAILNSIECSLKILSVRFLNYKYT